MNFEIRYYTAHRGVRTQVERDQLSAFVIRSKAVDRIVNDVIDRTGDGAEKKIA